MLIGGSTGLAMALGGCGSSTTRAVVPSNIHLQIGYLPAGWTVRGYPAAPDKFQQQQLYACLGAAVPTVVSQHVSPLFGVGEAMASYSVTQVLPTSTMARADLATLGKPAFNSCAPTLITQVFSSLPPGTSFGALSTVHHTVPKVADGLVSYRLTMPTLTGSKASTAEADVTFVWDGAVLVETVFVGATGPPNTAVEDAALQKRLGVARNA